MFNEVAAERQRLAASRADIAQLVRSGDNKLSPLRSLDNLPSPCTDSEIFMFAFRDELEKIASQSVQQGPKDVKASVRAISRQEKGIQQMAELMADAIEESIKSSGHESTLFQAQWGTKVAVATGQVAEASSNQGTTGVHGASMTDNG